MIGHKWRPEVDGTMTLSRDGMYLVETPKVSGVPGSMLRVHFPSSPRAR